MGILCPQIPADIGIPSPAAIVKASDIIVVGEFQASVDTNVVFRVNKFLRGSASDTGRNSLNVVVPGGGQIIAFDLPRIAQEHLGKTVIILGDVGPNGTISMKWYFGSIWPTERFDTFPSDNLENCERFIKTILKYEKYSGKPAELIPLLLQDVETPDVYAAFDFMDVGLKDCLPGSDEHLEKLVIWSAFSKLKIDGTPSDSFLQAKLLSIFPMLPFSVAAPHFLDAASVAEPASLGTRYVATVGTMLRAKKLVGTDLISKPEVFLEIFESARTNLQREDAEIAINAFDFIELGFPERAADYAIETILSHKLSEIESMEKPQKRKELWQQKIWKHF